MKYQSNPTGDEGIVLHAESIIIQSRVPAVLTGHHRMVTFIRLQCDLSNGLEFAGSQCLHLLGEHGRRCDRRIDTARFYRDDNVSAVLEEILRIMNDNARLIWLGDVRKYDVDGRDQHAVLVW